MPKNPAITDEEIHRVAVTAFNSFAELLRERSSSVEDSLKLPASLLLMIHHQLKEEFSLDQLCAEVVSMVRRATVAEIEYAS